MQPGEQSLHDTNQEVKRIKKMNTTLVCKGVSGITYNLIRQLGAGGEGSVFTIQGNNDKVAKIYNKKILQNRTLRDQRERKLKAMLKLDLPVRVDGILRLAWPLDILYQQGVCVGFVMPIISDMLGIYDIQRCWRADSNNPSTKKVLKIYPEFTWKYSVQFAYNLSWVVSYVHSRGIVIGDLNYNNIFADTKTGAIVLIDCDSFDITDKQTGERFPCEVGFPEMLAPELQTGGKLKGRFTKETDNFTLAIHIFRLLMRNADPFGGVSSPGPSIPAVASGNINIINGNCPYVRKCALTIPAWAPELSILPPNLQNLFKRTFYYDAMTSLKRIRQRATAAEWCRELITLAKKDTDNSLVKCRRNEYHVYPIHNTKCPWCKCEQPVKTRIVSNKPVQPANTNNNIVSGQVSSKSSSGGSQAIPHTTYTIQTARRKPYLLYCVIIICGPISGIIFKDAGSEAILQIFGEYLEPAKCVIIISIIASIGGILLAHHFEDSYIYAKSGIPWMLLGCIVLLIPPAVAIAAGAAAAIVTYIMGTLSTLLIVIFGIVILCGCLSGS